MGWRERSWGGRGEGEERGKEISGVEVKILGEGGSEGTGRKGGEGRGRQEISGVELKVLGEQGESAMGKYGVV